MNLTSACTNTVSCAVISSAVPTQENATEHGATVAAHRTRGNSDRHGEERPAFAAFRDTR